MPKFEIPKSGSKLPAPNDFGTSKRRASISSAQTAPSFHSSGSITVVTQTTVCDSLEGTAMGKRYGQKKGGNFVSESYRALWVCNDNWTTEIGKFFDNDPVFDDGEIDFFGSNDDGGINTMDHALEPIFEVASQMSTQSAEFMIDVRRAGRQPSAASNDIEDITDCMSRTFEDLGATIGANDYSKVEGRPEQFRENYSQGNGRGPLPKRRHSSSDGGSTGQSLMPPNPLFFKAQRTQDRWKGSMDINHG